MGTGDRKSHFYCQCRRRYSRESACLVRREKLFRSFRVLMRSFCDLLRQKPSCLFMLFRWSSSSVSSLMIQSVCLDIMTRILMLCSCLHMMVQVNAALCHCWLLQIIKPNMLMVLLHTGLDGTSSLPGINLPTFSWDAVYAWCLMARSFLTEENWRLSLRVLLLNLA